MAAKKQELGVMPSTALEEARYGNLGSYYGP